MDATRRTIILSPLDWGLGHASRCIPLAKALISSGFEPVLAGSGPSLELISKEFPQLKTYDLPSYNIRYSENPSLLSMNLLFQAPRIFKTVRQEHEIIQKLIEKEKAIGIISDSRFGLRSKKVISIYLSHQLMVKSGVMTPLTSAVHRNLISKFDACWVCDYSGNESLAGQLSANRGRMARVHWIGPLSRFSHKVSSNKDIDLTVVLSGPEPSRSQFEKLLMEELSSFDGKVILVQGILGEEKRKRQTGNITVYNYLLGDDLEGIMKRSKLIVCRSGYSSIMDLEAIGAKALLVPTPGQAEQEYLGAYHQIKGNCLVLRQSSFREEELKRALEYPGFETKKTSKSKLDKSLFDVFLRK